MPRITLSTPNKAVPHPGYLPWMSEEAIAFLRGHLASTHKVFEWGSGGSTVFFAKRASVVSIEHDVEWFRRTSVHSGGDVRLHQFERLQDGSLCYRKYVQAIDAFPANHFDWIVIDGIERPRCIQRAPKHLKPGGYLIIDDAWRDAYLTAQKQMRGFEVALEGQRTKIYIKSTVQ